MAKSVTTKPTTLSRFTAIPINSTKKRRVAVYARVILTFDEKKTFHQRGIALQRCRICDL